jgi:hypothetical protein
MTNSAYAKNNGDGLLYSILCLLPWKSFESLRVTTFEIPVRNVMHHSQSALLQDLFTTDYDIITG